MYLFQCDLLRGPFSDSLIATHPAPYTTLFFSWYLAMNLSIVGINAFHQICCTYIFWGQSRTALPRPLEKMNVTM